MRYVTYAVAAFLLLSNAVFGAESGDCPPWPKAHVEAQKLRTQLCNSDVAALEDYFSKRQRDYESGVIDGGQLLWSFDGLFQPYPYQRLAQWLERYPKSYSAHIAVARELIDRALSIRGDEAAAKTSPENLAAMDSLLQRAQTYLTRSIPLTRKPYVTYHQFIRSGRYTTRTIRDALVPHPELKQYLDRAIALDGRAYNARLVYMISLETRWGGNLKAMNAHLQGSLDCGLSKAQADRLRSLVLYEQAWQLDPARHGEERMKLTRDAAGLYEDMRYLRDIIWLNTRANRWADAFPDIERAIALNPDDLWVRSRRARSLFAMNRHTEAFQDFLISAKNGEAFAQNKVGYYLYTGVGGTQNKREAAQWFAKAAGGGDKAGMENLERVKAEGLI